MSLDPHPAPPGPQVAGPQAASAVTPQPAPTAAPAVLDGAQRALLRAVLNRLVPAHAGLPGAGDLDVGSAIERTLAAAPGLRRLFLDGLVAITIASPGFIDLEPDQQTIVLRRVEQQHPAFFVALVEHTYRGYYTLPRVCERLGEAARPPQPLGHDLPAFDPELLRQQRQRAPFWRRTS